MYIYYINVYILYYMYYINVYILYIVIVTYNTLKE